MRVRPLLFSSWLLIGCGARTGVDAVDPEVGTADAPMSEVAIAQQGVLLDDCGPTDGSALAFHFERGSPIACSSPGAVKTFDQIRLWSDLPSGPTTISFTADSPGVRGDGASCVEGTCEVARSVTLTLTKYSPSGTIAEGSYALTFHDGRVASGTFVVTQCHNPIMCG